MHEFEEMNAIVFQKVEIGVKRFAETEHIYSRNLELARWIILDQGIDPLVDIDISARNTLLVCNIIREAYGFYPISNKVLCKIQNYERLAMNPNLV